MPNFREFTPDDEQLVTEMMKIFYSSSAVSTDGSDEIFKRDFEACVSQSPYIEGYVLLDNSDAAGYAMLAKSFCTEFGKPCVWIEDIYIIPEYRGKGIATSFINSIKEKYSNSVIRLEVEEDNYNALSVYKKSGFAPLPYDEMIYKGE